MRISDLLARESDPRSPQPIGQLDGWAFDEEGEGRPSKPNPKTQSYIYLSSRRDPAWPHFIFFIENQIPWLRRSPRTKPAASYTHADGNVCTNLQALVMYYTRSTTIPSVRRHHLTPVCWNPCILIKVELGLRRREKLDHAWKIMWHINNIHAVTQPAAIRCPGKRYPVPNRNGFISVRLNQCPALW